jgi:hypothetical protein
MRPKRAPRRLLATLALAVALGAAGLPALALFTGCASLLEAAKQRLALFGVGFAVEKVDVSRLVFPSSVFGVADLGRYGVDVRVAIKAGNKKPYKAVFDGAAAKLRVQKTGASDPAVTGSLPAFSVEGNSETVFEATFPLRLDSPVFGKKVWKSIIRGEDIPYKVDAELALRFPEGLPGETKTVPMTVIASKVNVREKSGAVVEGLLKAIDLAF